MDSCKYNFFKALLKTYYSCVVVSETAETLHSACIFIFCCVKDICRLLLFGRGSQARGHEPDFKWKLELMTENHLENGTNGAWIV